MKNINTLSPAYKKTEGGNVSMFIRDVEVYERNGIIMTLVWDYEDGGVQKLHSCTIAGDLYYATVKCSMFKGTIDLYPAIICNFNQLRCSELPNVSETLNLLNDTIKEFNLVLEKYGIKGVEL